MLIPGTWIVESDGVLRPGFRAQMLRADGTWLPISLQADTGADRTVLSADVLVALGLPLLPAPTQLAGVGGPTASVLVDTAFRLAQVNGVFAIFKGRFFGFMQPEALDMSVLGRDVTNRFALIGDRPQDVVCLVGQGHRSVIV
jgi:hypothetical protein